MTTLRNIFADTMLEIGVRDHDLVVLVGDISHGILQPFSNACPGRYFNIGICEPATVNVAAGLSRVGLIPVVHTIAPFLIERSYEQIKLDFGYQKLGVNLVSVGSAFDYAQLGCSHHCYTDISLIGHLPGSRIFCPGSAVEFKVLFKNNYRSNAICYYRLSEQCHRQMIPEADVLNSRCVVFRPGSDLTIACFGTHLRTACILASRLGELAIQAEILYFHTLKPFDGDTVRTSLQKTKRLLCIDEASSSDGLFNLVLRSTIGIDNARYVQVAIDDFIHIYGSYEDLCEHCGFTPQAIESRLRTTFPELFRTSQ